MIYLNVKMIDLMSKSVDFTQDEADDLDNVKWENVKLTRS